MRNRFNEPSGTREVAVVRYTTGSVAHPVSHMLVTVAEPSFPVTGTQDTATSLGEV